MSFVQPQATSGRHSLGIGVAIVFHVALVWALMNGLAHNVVQAISEPIETKIVEEVIPPPPPPPKPLEIAPPPSLKPPPPAYVPPPEVSAEPPSLQPAITATTAEPPPTTPLPAQPRAEPAPESARVPVPVAASVVCSNYSAVMGAAAFPREAERMGLEEGSALIQFTLGANGGITAIKAVSASHPVFAKNSIQLISQYRCAGQGREVLVQVPFTYKSE